MNPVEYVFSIDAFSPETLPMSRLAEYLAALAKLLGHAENTHFKGVEKGSAMLRAAVEAVAAPKVEARLQGVRLGDGVKDAVAGKQALEDLLANDNAIATLVESDTGRVILPFVGRNRPKPLSFPPFRERTSITGQVVSIGGRDASAHATLQDGDTFHVNVSMNRETARQLAQLLYGPTVKLNGNGRFERQSGGQWKLLDFRVESFEVLEDIGINQVLERVRATFGDRLDLSSEPQSEERGGEQL